MTFPFVWCSAGRLVFWIVKKIATSVDDMTVSGSRRGVTIATSADIARTSSKMPTTTTTTTFTRRTDSYFSPGCHYMRALITQRPTRRLYKKRKHCLVYFFFTKFEVYWFLSSQIGAYFYFSRFAIANLKLSRKMTYPL